jgi:hypothetical protein
MIQEMLAIGCEVDCAFFACPQSRTCLRQTILSMVDKTLAIGKKPSHGPRDASVGFPGNVSMNGVSTPYLTHACIPVP